MHLELLQVSQVRNLTAVTITPGPNLNVLSGPNASGKTAILESIYLLARARSFRTPRIQDVIQHGNKALQVRGEILQEKQGKITTGIEKRVGESKIRYNGETIKSVSEQARNIPLVLLTPDSHIIVSGSPTQRRHWLDWAMFHVEPDYLSNWKQYFKALRQRNSLLKRGVSDRESYRGWERAMVESAAVLQDSRADFIQILSGLVKQLTGDFFPENIALKFDSGWSNVMSFENSLKEAWGTDSETGFTRAGPHRADVRIMIENNKLSSVFSRGQIKLFVCILMLAQAKALYSKTGIKPVVLLDDFNAELDPVYSEYLLSLLYEENFQVFLTTTDTQSLQLTADRCHWFHVKQGVVQSVSQQTCSDIN